MAKLEDAYKQNAELRSEAAQFRVATQYDALKKNSALKTVLEKHNVGFVVETADLSKMEIENGAVKGAFEYARQKVLSHEVKTPNQPPVQTPSNQGLTMESLKTMSAQAEINKNWAQVKQSFRDCRSKDNILWLLIISTLQCGRARLFQALEKQSIFLGLCGRDWEEDASGAETVKINHYYRRRDYYRLF